MIYDLLDSYRKSSGDSDALALDSYILPNGLYIRLDMDGSVSDELMVNRDTAVGGDLYNWFRKVDFYSRIIEMNKAVDNKKKIHSNNMYSVFFKYGEKYDTLISKGKLSPVFKESIIRYYDGLTKLNKKQTAILDSFNLPEIDKDILERNRAILLSLSDWLVERVLSYGFTSDTYIKIFFDASIDEYKIESQRYLIPRIFNTIDHNIEIDGMSYGLSNTNMGLNSKKPYLEHKTTNYRVPFRINIEDALYSKSMMEWLENQKKDDKPVLSGYLPINIDEQYSFSDRLSDEMNGHYLHLEKGMKTIIDDYDFLPGITDKIEPFRLNNYLRLKDFNVETINSREKLEGRVDEWLYNKNLKKNYYIDRPKPRAGFSSQQVDLLILSKVAMINFFKKCDDTSLRGCIDRVSLELIKESIINNTYPFIERTNIARAMNLRLSMLKYFEIGGKENMGDIIMPLWDMMKEKIIDDQSNENQVCESDIEFYFAAGQLTRYLLSLSQAQNINYDIMDPILNARDANKIKKEIYGLMKRYSHALNSGSKRTNRLIALVMGYNPENPLEMKYDAFIAGFASHNIIYYKEEVKK